MMTRSFSLFWLTCLCLGGYMTAAHASVHPAQPSTLISQEIPFTTAKYFSRIARELNTAPVTKWTNNIVFYTLVNASQTFRQIFLDAASRISAQSAVRFIERTTEENYLLVSDSYQYGICGTRALGMVGGPQSLVFNPACYLGETDKDSVLREILYALGLAHEDTQTTQYNALTEQDIAQLNVLYPPSALANTLPRMPLTDNGLAISVNKRYFALPENSTVTLAIQFPPGIKVFPGLALQAKNDRGETLNTADLPIRLSVVKIPEVRDDYMIKRQQTNTLRLRLDTSTVQRPTLVEVILDNIDPEGGSDKILSAFAQVHILPPQQYAQSFHQLVSAHPSSYGQRQCLSAQRSDEHKLLSRRLYTNDFFIDYQTLADFSLAALPHNPDMYLLVKLEPCDSESLWQRWRYDEASGLLIHKTEKHSLDIDQSPLIASTPPSLRVNLIVPPADTSTISHVWQKQGRQFIHRHSGLALTATEGDELTLEQQTRSRAFYQNWDWD